MGKSAHKKKEKKKDFQKVKLKVGKKLPKADNFTDTSFKSRGIVIREQLKQNEGEEPVTQRKQSITDLLCHVNHYNARVRQTALSDLKDLLTANPLLIQTHLSLLIENLAVIFIDKEEIVRNSGFPIISLLISNVPANHISPFFPVFCAHLCCAMTHIQEDIQLDSLKILDLLLEGYPELIISRSRELLTNFVLQISCQRNNVGGSSTVELSSAPSSKLAHQKWRLKVLERLNSFLSAIMTSLHVQNQHSVAPRDISTTRSFDVSAGRTVNVQLFRGSTSAQPWLQEGFTLRSFDQTGTTSKDFISSSSEIQQFIQTVVPLLLQSWIEAAPGIYGKHNPGATLSAAAIDMLGGVASVLRLLWRWMEEVSMKQKEHKTLTELCSSYKKKFVQSLCVGFPYGHIDPVTSTKKKSKKTKRVALTVSPLHLNLTLCELMSYFATNNHERWAKTLVEFVCDTLETESDLSIESCQSLLGVVYKLVNTISDSDTRISLLEATISFYKLSHPLSQNKQLALNCVTNLSVLDRNGEFGLSSTPSTNTLIQTIPSLLVQLKATNLNASHNALQVLLQAASTGNKDTVDCIQRRFLDLIDPTEGILLSYPENLQREIMELVHYMTNFSRDHFKVLSDVFRDTRVSISCVVYGIQILACKLLKTDHPLTFDLADLISFLFTLSVGPFVDNSRNETEEILLSHRPKLPEKLSPFAITKVPIEDLHKARSCCKCICQTYSLISSKSQLWAFFQDAISKSLAKQQELSSRNVFGILESVSYLFCNVSNSKTFEAHFLELFTTVLYATVQDSTTIFVENGWEETLWRKAVEILVKWNGWISKLFRKVNSDLHVLTDSEQFRLIATVIIRVLQADELKRLVHEAKDELKILLRSIEESSLLSEDTRWMAELRYEAGLVIGAVS